LAKGAVRKIRLLFDFVIRLPVLILRSVMGTFRSAMSVPRLSTSGLRLPGDASPDHTSAVDAGASGNDVDALIRVGDAFDSP